MYHAHKETAEYPQKIGWGHSYVSFVKQLALDAQVKRLALFHHEPTRNDEAMAALEAEVKADVAKRSDGAIEAFAAYEGLEVVL